MAQNQKMTFQIVEDSFPALEKRIKEYERHCVTYLIHNNSQIYIGETSHLKSRFADHAKNKSKYNLIKTKIIISEYFNKSATYDIETRLINYFYADRTLEVLNVKTGQKSHNYHLKKEINDQLFNDIWEKLIEKKLASLSIQKIENSHLFKYSPFKEFSDEQLFAINKVIDLITVKTSEEDLAFDGTVTTIREFKKVEQKILIEGGPGTGKTLLIVKLVHDLLKQHLIADKTIAICIPQSNLQKTFRMMLKTARIRVKILKPVDLSRLKDDELDLLIVDEAHRLKKHFNKQSKDLKHLQGGKYTELDLAVSKSKHLVLMYDSKQTVRPADINHLDIAKLRKLTTFPLSQQFRIKKGYDYLVFIEKLLQIKEGRPDAHHLGDYELKIIDNINQLHRIIVDKDKQFGLSRLASGYFKQWISKKNPKLNDFEDEGLALKWNTEIVRWAHSDKAINEVGCIHTLQGEDLNYAGVIIGDEIYYDPSDDKIKIRKENYFDQNGTPIAGTDHHDKKLTEYIKNIYYVLLTRGMLGTYVYIKDPALKKYFKDVLKT